MSGNGRPISFSVFEVDLHTRELRKQGTRLRLEEKPFQVLELLLERKIELSGMTEHVAFRPSAHIRMPMFSI